MGVASSRPHAPVERFKRLALALVASLFALASLHVTNAVAQRVVRASGVVQIRDTSAHSAIAPDRYRVHRFTKVNVTRDIAYRESVANDGASVVLHLDVYEPAGDTVKNRPAVLWFHSGGFIAGSKAEEATYATDFARRGYVSIAVDYRQRPRMYWFDMLQRGAAARDADGDAVAAVAWVRDRAGSYGIDPGRIFAAGYSSGAITAFDLAYPPVGGPSPIAGGVAIAGYTYGHPSPGGPPVLEFHGTVDPMIPYALGEGSCEQAQRVGDRCDLVTFTGASHDIGIVRGTEIEDRTADFLARLNDRSR